MPHLDPDNLRETIIGTSVECACLAAEAALAQPWAKSPLDEVHGTVMFGFRHEQGFQQAPQDCAPETWRYDAVQTVSRRLSPTSCNV